MQYEQLKLDNQMCFPFYAVSRLIIRRYQPLLDRLGITYPQYLVLLVLWENDNQPVNNISKMLYLNTNTITPLIKRLEKMQIVEKHKGTDDERKMYVKLTQKGMELKHKASQVPTLLIKGVELPGVDLLELKNSLRQIIDSIK